MQQVFISAKISILSYETNPWTENVLIIWLTYELYDPAKGRRHLLLDYSVITSWDEGFDLAPSKGNCVCVIKVEQKWGWLKVAVGWYFVFLKLEFNISNHRPQTCKWIWMYDWCSAWVWVSNDIPVIFAKTRDLLVCINFHYSPLNHGACWSLWQPACFLGEKGQWVPPPFVNSACDLSVP